MPGALQKRASASEKRQALFCALSREIPLIREFSENFQKSMSFFGLRGCGKRVEGVFEKNCNLMSFSRPLMWLLSSRGKSFDAVFTFLLWMLRYRSRGNTTLAPPGSASADRLKRKSKLMSIWGGQCCGYRDRKFFERIYKSDVVF